MPLSNLVTSSVSQGPSLGINPGGGGIADAINSYNRAEAQKKIANFLEKTGPALVSQLNDATDAGSVLKVRNQLHTEALKAGFDPAHLDSLDKAIIGPSLANLGADQIAEMGRQLQPQTTATEQPVNLPAISGPLGPGLEQANLTAPELTTTPGRAFSQGDALKLAEIEARTGVKPPSGLSSLIAAPSATAEKEAQASAANQLASRRQVQRQMDERQIKAIEDLPEDQIGDTGVTTRGLGMATKGSGLTGYINESRKEAAQAPVRQSQVTLNAARTNQANAQADRARQLAKQVGGSARMTAYYNEFVKLGGNPDDQSAYLDYVEKRSAAGRKPDYLETHGGLSQGGANRSTGSSGKSGQRQGPPTAASVLRKYGVGQ